MGSKGSRRALPAVAAALVTLPFLAASAAPARPAHGVSCTAGASSVRARVVDGKIVTTAPSVSGCVPK